MKAMRIVSGPSGPSSRLDNVNREALLQQESDSHLGYSGTRAQLIAAGLARDGDFPGDPGAPVTSHTVRRDDTRMHISIHSRMVNPVTYWVRLSKKRISERKAEARARRAEERSRRLDDDEETRIATLKDAIRRGEDIGIIRTDYPVATKWTGRRADLLAAGICTDDQLPAAPRRVRYSEAGDGDAILFWDSRLLVQDCFIFTVRHSSQEIDKRRAAGIGREPKERPAKYLDQSAFAKDCETYLMVLSGAIAREITGEWEEREYGEHTIRYDEKTVQAVVDALDHARQLLQAATPQTIKPRQSNQLKSARADTDFRAFLARVPGADNRASGSGG